MGREGVNGVFASPIALWNVKNASYLALAAVVPHCTALRYEDLLADPAAALAQAAARCDLHPLPGGFRNVDASTKDAGRDFQSYQDYYLAERWQDKLSAAALDCIGAGLDAGLLQAFGYERL